MAAKAGDKVYGRQWCDCLNENILAVPWNLPATVKWQRRLVLFHIGEVNCAVLESVTVMSTQYSESMCIVLQKRSDIVDTVELDHYSSSMVDTIYSLIFAAPYRPIVYASRTAILARVISSCSDSAVLVSVPLIMQFCTHYTWIKTHNAVLYKTDIRQSISCRISNWPLP